MIFKFSGKKQKKETCYSGFLKNKINLAYKECTDKLNFELDKKDELEKNAKELIVDIYYVPEKYWYEELKYFNEIKSLKENRDIADEIRNKTNKLLFGYINEIEICKAKIELYEVLRNKYEEIKERIRSISDKEKTEKRNKRSLDVIEKFKEKLNGIKNENFSDTGIYKDSENLINLKREISEIEEDLKIKSEVKKYIDGLNDIFENFEYDSVEEDLIKTEIKKIKKQQNERNEKKN